MNFVGHAIAARWEDDDPRHGAGAMLPDLARMCDVATPTVHDDIVRRGVRCHHRVDAAFHDGPAFLGLMREARAFMEARGVPRAARLAAAHVGVELLLDGAWLGAQERARAFGSAAEGAKGLGTSAIAWPDDRSRERFATLCERLPDIAVGYASPQVVGDRILRILGRRPRFDPGPASAAIRAWAIAAAPQVEAAAERVLEDLRARMEAAP